jgi:hypothetical protein
MSNEERIAIEAVLRSYKAMIQVINESWMNQSTNYADRREQIERAQGKIDGCTEVLRDLMRELK